MEDDSKKINNTDENPELSQNNNIDSTLKL